MKFIVEIWRKYSAMPTKALATDEAKKDPGFFGSQPSPLNDKIGARGFEIDRTDRTIPLLDRDPSTPSDSAQDDGMEMSLGVTVV
jgi:hypothetical protein